MNILEMSPSREMDALVAEKVMGWYKVRLMTSGNRTDWEGFPPGVYGSTRVRRYSKDISAAYEMEDKVYSVSAEMGLIYARYLIDVMNLGENRNLSTLAKLIHATPEQRCKAALMAMEG